MQKTAIAPTVNEILVTLNRLAPFDHAANWDNVGLLTGSPDQQSTGILIALDVTEGLLDEALARGLNTIISHHPLIFTPLKHIRTDLPAGRLLQKALYHELAIIGCHTNLDVATGGVNDILAEQLGLIDTQLLQETIPGCGFGRIGRLAEPLVGTAFLEKMLATLQTNTAKIAGPLPDTITTVALCGGSGSDLAELAFDRGAQLYLSAEIKHSTARWAEALGFCIIDAGHYATENLIVNHFTASLKAKLAQANAGYPILATASQTSPFRQLVKHNEIFTYYE